MTILQILFLNLILINFYILVFAFTQTKRRKIYYVAFWHILISFFILNTFKVDITLLPNTSLQFSMIKGFQSLHLTIYISIFFIILTVSLVLLYKENQYEKNTITRTSIKESIDNLPMGLSFSTDKGMILLSNRYMNKLCHEITGRELQDAEAFWKDVIKNKTPILQLDNGQTWSFSRNPIKVNNKKGIQITAINVTELDKLQSQLKNKNLTFVKMNIRLHQYGKNLAAIKSKEERLTTKVQLHNELGYMLLVTRKILGNNEFRENGKFVLDLWKQNIDMLLSGAGLKGKDDLEELLQSASDIGIKLGVQGELPKESRIKDIIITATIEALNNAIRHAQATELKLIIKETEKEYTIELTNNGILPKGEITESGGLSALREKVEDQGGKMGIGTKPVFKLWIIVYKIRGDRYGKSANS